MDYNKAVFVLIIHFFIIFSFIFTKGFYSFGGAILVILSLCLLFFLASETKIKFTIKTSADSFRLLLFVGLFISVALSLLLYGGLYQKMRFLYDLSRLLLVIALCLTVFSFFKKPKIISLGFIYKQRFLLLLIIAFLLRIFMIISSPFPRIDVWEKLMLASLGILKGKSPYLLKFLEYKNFYPEITSNVFGHLPGLFIFFVPIYFIFSDIRFIYFFSDLLVVYLFKKIAANQETKLINNFILLYLYNPVSLFVLEQAWLEPFMLSLLLAFFYLFKSKKEKAAAFFMAIFLTTKSVGCLIIPLLFKYKKLKIKILVFSIILAEMITFPFFILSPVDFLNDIFLNAFKTSNNSAPVHIALTFRNLLKDLYDGYYGTKLAMGISFLYVFLIYFFIKIKTFFQMFLVIALLYLGFYFFNYQAFCNYYFFISGLLIFSLVAYFYKAKPGYIEKQK